MLCTLDTNCVVTWTAIYTDSGVTTVTHDESLCHNGTTCRFVNWLQGVANYVAIILHLRSVPKYQTQVQHRGYL